MTHKKSNIRKYSLFIALLFIGFVCAPLQAKDFHDPPRNYRFGNNFDSHQEAMLKLDKNGKPASLSGFFYIKFKLNTVVEGLPLAEHPSGSDCVDTPEICEVGWTFEAIPSEAIFVFHEGEKDDHPVWLLDRIQIPQPGSFTHFHWITAQSNLDPRSISVPQSCNVSGANQLTVDENGEACPGWLIQIRAVREFAFEHGDEIVPVRPGLDNATHLNLITNVPIGWLP